MITVGVWLEQRVARLRSFGVRDALTIEGATLRRLVKSTVAGTLAWEVAALIHSPRPVLASLGAILVIQVTVRASFSRSIQLTVAVTIGLAGALLLGHVLGLHWWSVGVTILAALIVGELLRLGPFSAQAAISALLALSLGSTYGYERIIDTAIGAGIGVLVNALIAPPTYVQEASQALRRIGDDLSALLGDIAGGLTKSPERGSVERWLARAREISAAVRAAEATVSQGEESLRFNHRAAAETENLERLGEARLALEHTVTQTRGMVRSMLELYPELHSPQVAPVLQALSDLLRSAGVQVATFGRLQQQPDLAADRDESERAHQEALAARDRAAVALRAMPPSTDGTTRLLASILVDGERLIREVDVRDGAHLTAVTDVADP
ncbi:MAG TPA: aromatic acid exporter family protein [Jatrophihabitantaceae bacterium]|jgi:uncharacterized membrane protein YccC